MNLRTSSLPRNQRPVREVMGAALAPAGAEPQAEAVEVKVDHRRGVEREYLAEDEPAHDGNAERTAQLAAVAEADRERQGAKQRRAGGHHDGAEAQQAGLKDRLLRREALGALGVERTKGLTSQQAIYEACLLRFRPIMMTTSAALFGALPLAIGLGDGGELRRPLDRKSVV